MGPLPTWSLEVAEDIANLSVVGATVKWKNEHWVAVVFLSGHTLVAPEELVPKVDAVMTRIVLTRIVLFETDGDLVAELGQLEERLRWGEEPFDGADWETDWRPAADAVAALASRIRLHESGELGMLRPIDRDGTELNPLIFVEFAFAAERERIRRAAHAAGDFGLRDLIGLEWDANRELLAGLGCGRVRLGRTEEIAYGIVAVEMLRSLRAGPLERFGVFGR